MIIEPKHTLRFFPLRRSRTVLFTQAEDQSHCASLVCHLRRNNCAYKHEAAPEKTIVCSRPARTLLTALMVYFSLHRRPRRRRAPASNAM